MKSDIREIIIASVKKLYTEEIIDFDITRPKLKSHGNFSSNIALVLSKKLKVNEEIEIQDKINLRQYGVGAQILSDLGVKNMILLSNSKKKAIGLKGFDLSIDDWERLD